jgi:hypothetical protein
MIAERVLPDQAWRAARGHQTMAEAESVGLHIARYSLVLVLV